jgi:hypothetical protein
MAGVSSALASPLPTHAYPLASPPATAKKADDWLADKFSALVTHAQERWLSLPEAAAFLHRGAKRAVDIIYEAVGPVGPPVRPESGALFIVDERRLGAWREDGWEYASMPSAERARPLAGIRYSDGSVYGSRAVLRAAGGEGGPAAVTDTLTLTFLLPAVSLPSTGGGDFTEQTVVLEWGGTRGGVQRRAVRLPRVGASLPLSPGGRPSPDAGWVWLVQYLTDGAPPIYSPEGTPAFGEADTAALDPGLDESRASELAADGERIREALSALRSPAGGRVPLPATPPLPLPRPPVMHTGPDDEEILAALGGGEGHAVVWPRAREAPSGRMVGLSSPAAPYEMGTPAPSTRGGAGGGQERGGPAPAPPRTFAVALAVAEEEEEEDKRAYPSTLSSSMVAHVTSRLLALPRPGGVDDLQAARVAMARALEDEEAPSPVEEGGEEELGYAAQHLLQRQREREGEEVRRPVPHPPLAVQPAPAPPPAPAPAPVPAPAPQREAAEAGRRGRQRYEEESSQSEDEGGGRRRRDAPCRRRTDSRDYDYSSYSEGEGEERRRRRTGSREGGRPVYRRSRYEEEEAEEEERRRRRQTRRPRGAPRRAPASLPPLAPGVALMNVDGRTRLVQVSVRPPPPPSAPVAAPLAPSAAQAEAAALMAAQAQRVRAVEARAAYSGLRASYGGLASAYGGGRYGGGGGWGGGPHTGGYSVPPPQPYGAPGSYDQQQQYAPPFGNPNGVGPPAPAFQPPPAAVEGSNPYGGGAPVYGSLSGGGEEGRAVSYGRLSSPQGGGGEPFGGSQEREEEEEMQEQAPPPAPAAMPTALSPPLPAARARAAAAAAAAEGQGPSPPPSPARPSPPPKAAPASPVAKPGAKKRGGGKAGDGSALHFACEGGGMPTLLGRFAPLARVAPLLVACILGWRVRAVCRLKRVRTLCAAVQDTQRLLGELLASGGEGGEGGGAFLTSIRAQLESSVGELSSVLTADGGLKGAIEASLFLRAAVRAKAEAKQPISGPLLSWGAGEKDGKEGPEAAAAAKGAARAAARKGTLKGGALGKAIMATYSKPAGGEGPAAAPVAAAPAAAAAEKPWLKARKAGPREREAPADVFVLDKGGKLAAGGAEEGYNGGICAGLKPSGKWRVVLQAVCAKALAPGVFAPGTLGQGPGLKEAVDPAAPPAASPDAREAVATCFLAKTGEGGLRVVGKKQASPPFPKSLSPAWERTFVFNLPTRLGLPEDAGEVAGRSGGLEALAVMPLTLPGWEVRVEVTDSDRFARDTAMGCVGVALATLGGTETEAWLPLQATAAGDRVRGSICLRYLLLPPDAGLRVELLAAEFGAGGEGGGPTAPPADYGPSTVEPAAAAFLKRRSANLKAAPVDWSHVQPRTQSHVTGAVPTGSGGERPLARPPSIGPRSGTAPAGVRMFKVPDYSKVSSRVASQPAAAVPTPAPVKGRRRDLEAEILESRLGYGGAGAVQAGTAGGGYRRFIAGGAKAAPPPVYDPRQWVGGEEEAHPPPRPAPSATAVTGTGPHGARPPPLALGSRIPVPVRALAGGGGGPQPSGPHARPSLSAFTLSAGGGGGNDAMDAVAASIDRFFASEDLTSSRPHGPAMVHSAALRAAEEAAESVMGRAAAVAPRPSTGPPASSSVLDTLSPELRALLSSARAAVSAGAGAGAAGAGPRQGEKDRYVTELRRSMAAPL